MHLAWTVMSSLEEWISLTVTVFIMALRMDSFLEILAQFVTN